jgi:hypothetical protein
MASELLSEKPAATARKPPRGWRSPASTSPQGGAPPLSEGLEAIRGGDC